MKNYFTCPYCGKIFRIELTEQTPGFRWKEDLNCPHCGKYIRSSMEYEFSVYIDDDD